MLVEPEPDVLFIFTCVLEKVELNNCSVFCTLKFQTLELSET